MVLRAAAITRALSHSNDILHLSFLRKIDSPPTLDGVTLPSESSGFEGHTGQTGGCDTLQTKVLIPLSQTLGMAVN